MKNVDKTMGTVTREIHFSRFFYNIFMKFCEELTLVDK
jgi:hypothetical protein